MRTRLRGGMSKAASAMSARIPGDVLILVADIGGTNTRLALARGGRVQQDTIRRFSNADFDGPQAVIAAALAAWGTPPPEAGIIAIAGVVEGGPGGRAHATNLAWELDAHRLAHDTGIARIWLMNDLQAHGYALSGLPGHSFTPILPGRPADPDASRLVIGIGTGFNACPIHRVCGHDFVPPAEYGHADLPVQTDAEVALARALAPDGARATIEDLLSGPGLGRGYAALSGGQPLAPEHILARAATDPQAGRVLALVVPLLGRVAGDLALAHLPFGGIYLVGGAAQALAPFLGPMGFATAFLNRRQMSDSIQQIGVSVVFDDTAALTGCARALLA